MAHKDDLSPSILEVSTIYTMLLDLEYIFKFLMTFTI